MDAPLTIATLEPVRFGEFLRDRYVITEEEWLAALAEHWSTGARLPLGHTLVERGVLPAEVVEAEARAFHDELDVVEVVSHVLGRRPAAISFPI
jgi:hypothetical protein